MTLPITADQIWTDDIRLQEIRKTYAPNLTELEFSAFIQLGKATGLNPFLKELWAVKYDKSRPSQIFIGRDGYRKAAQRQPDYDYHLVDAVYSNDKFTVYNGEVNHQRGFGNRGALLGAYAVGRRKNSSVPVYVTVELREYDKNVSLWKTMKETMIKKTAEAQLLRQLFQEVFIGTFSEAEQSERFSSDTNNTQKTVQIVNERTQDYEFIPHTDGMAEDSRNTMEDQSASKATDERGNSERSRIISEASSDENAATNPSTEPASISKVQTDIISKLLAEKNFTTDRLERAFKFYKVSTVKELSEERANHFIAMLDKV